MSNENYQTLHGFVDGGGGLCGGCGHTIAHPSHGKDVSAPAESVSPAPQRGTAEYYATEQRVLDMAHEIITRVVSNVMRLAYARHDLADSLEDMTEDEFVQDALQMALGEETGCLDPEDLDAENCEVIFVEEKLRVLHSDYAAKCAELQKAESRLAEVRKALEMAMKALSVEQRLAVKAELEREGLGEVVANEM